MFLRPAGRPPGLTLIEVLFALSVIAFALLGVAGMFPSAMRSVLGGGQMTKATVLAREMVDMIRSEPFDKLLLSLSRGGYNGFDTRNLSVSCPVPLPSPTVFDANYNQKRWKCDMLATGTTGANPGDTGSGLPAAYGTVSVVCVNPNGTTGACGSTDLRRVRVTVTWESNGSRSVSLVTYVARIQ